MKKVVFKNEHERLVAWMKHLTRMAKREGKLIRDTGVRTEHYILPNGIHVLISSNEISIRRSVDDLYSGGVELVQYLDPVFENEINFYTEGTNLIQYAPYIGSKTGIILYLSGGRMVDTKDIKDLTEMTSIDELLELKLGEQLTPELREEYEEALEFYRAIESMMPDELRSSHEERSLPDEEEVEEPTKPQKQRSLYDMSIEELREIEEDTQTELAARATELERLQLISSIITAQQDMLDLDKKIADLEKNLRDEL